MRLLALAVASFPASVCQLEQRRLNIINGCEGQVMWIAHMSGAGFGPDEQNVRLDPGSSFSFATPSGLTGARYWPKMHCDPTGSRCGIGESGGPGQTCDSAIGCAPPVDTKFEATFGANGMDWIDVSLVDGWTLPFRFRTSKQCRPGDGSRKVVQQIDCSNLSIGRCPRAELLDMAAGATRIDLRLTHPQTNRTVGCYAPCSKLTYANWANADGRHGPADDVARKYCCPTPPETPQQCRTGPVKDTGYVEAVHRACPGVYGYSYDDGMGLLLCPADTQYEMTFFCPFGEGSMELWTSPSSPLVSPLVQEPQRAAQQARLGADHTVDLALLALVFVPTAFLCFAGVIRAAQPCIVSDSEAEEMVPDAVAPKDPIGAGLASSTALPHVSAFGSAECCAAIADLAAFFVSLTRSLFEQATGTLQVSTTAVWAAATGAWTSSAAWLSRCWADCSIPQPQCRSCVRQTCRDTAEEVQRVSSTHCHGAGNEWTQQLVRTFLSEDVLSTEIAEEVVQIESLRDAGPGLRVTLGREKPLDQYAPRWI